MYVVILLMAHKIKCVFRVKTDDTNVEVLQYYN